ncbi:hypothetical protein N0V82_009277 [Gnomoniopsis sp. IMI 355080]|nr:hypothetical protein N0V82_009277 [Gnomoniopsis sp. IMI 355080]
MTGSRRSKRAGKVSRREIVEPSHETRVKLENLSLSEEIGDVMGNEQASAAHSSHKGPLGRIQRSLKKMTSREIWQDQETRRNAGRVEVKEFREKAKAKKPRRFYPESSTNSDIIPPLVAPRARSYAVHNRLENLLTAHGASTAVGPPTGAHAAETQPAPTARQSGRNQPDFKKDVNKAFTADRSQKQNFKQRGLSDSPLSSADSFVTSAEVPEKPSATVRVPGPHARRSSEDCRTLREAPVIPARRSSRSSERHLARQSAEARRSEERSYEAAQVVQAPTSPVARYPPNSSRSGPVVHRSHSSGRHSRQQQQPGWTTPSPTSVSDEM